MQQFSFSRRKAFDCAFGVPGAAINPFYSALRARGTIRHVLARHVEGGLAYGRRLYARQSRQYRPLHRHIRPGRHRHDHRSLLGLRQFHPDPLHHRPGAARTADQGGFPGRRHRGHRRACRQMGGHGHGALSGADGAAEGVPPDALGPARPGPYRPADRCSACRDRVRHRRL